MTAVTVTDRSALAAALRNLKLFGMLATLDARLAQAPAGELGHLDLLQALCEDEVSRRETMSLARADPPRPLRDRATLEDFDFGASPEAPGRADPRPRRAALPRRRRVGHPPRPGRGRQEPHRPGPRPTSPSGAGADARFLKTSRVLADLAGGRADRTWDKRLAELTRPAVLILDDFAMRDFTAAQADDLYELITERAGKSLDPRPPTGPQPTGTRCSPTPSSPSRSWTGSSTQPPRPHERAKLPPQQAARACRPHREHERQLE